MNVTKSISYKLSKNQLEECKVLDVNEQISFINQAIFEDSGINHNERLNFQYELLKISEINKSLFNSAYILNLISQTNAQMGNLELALDNLLNAEKKWREILSNNKKDIPSLTINGLILCLSDIGNIYMKMGLFDDAMKYFESGEEFIDDTDDLFVPYFKIHFHLSEIYNKLDFHVKSKQMIQKCIKRVKSFKFNPPSRIYIYLVPANIQLSEIFKKEKKVHKSIETLNESLKMCEKFDDVIYKQQILMMLGDLHIENLNYNKAIKVLSDAESMHNKIGSDSNLIKIRLSIAEILVKEEKFLESREILEGIKIIAENNSLNVQLIPIYKMLSLIHENLNQQDKSFEYNKKHSNVISEYYINKNKALINENRKIIKDLSRAIKEKHEIQSAKDIESSKKYKIKSQTAKTLYRIREGNILESLKNDISTLKENIENHNHKHINSILNKISFYLRDQSSWKDFEDMFIQIHEDFIDNLNSISDELSPKQVRFCMFIKMGMDKYDICSLLNVTVRAVEQQRYRIKKIISPGSDLDKIIQDL